MESQVQSQNSTDVNYRHIYDHEYQKNTAYGHIANSPGNKIIQKQCHIISRFPRGKRKMVLDIGCGKGHVASFLSGYYDSVYGVDVSKEAIGCAQDMHRGKGIGFITGNINKIPLQDSQFDLVTCFDVLEHLTEQDVLLARAELLRVRKRDTGSILISVSTRPAGGNDCFGSNLHRSIRPVSWWMEIFKPGYWEFDKTNQNLVMWKN